MNVVELDRDHGLSVFSVLCGVKGLRCGDLCQLALPQRRTVQGGGGDGGWQVVLLFLLRSDGRLILRFNNRGRSGRGRGSGTGARR